MINNNKEKCMKKVLVIVMLIFAFGCKEDVAAPEDIDIVGNWARVDNTDKSDTINIKDISFSKDGKCYIQYRYIINQFPDTCRYSFSSDHILTITGGTCGDVTDKFKVVSKNKGIEFILLEDECDRAEKLPGYFESYPTVIVSPNPIMNDVRD